MNGLTDKEVNESRSKYGSNKIIPDKKDGFLKLFIESLGDPIIKILLIALAIKVIFLFKSFDWYETIGIVIAIFLASFISSISEYGSEKAFLKLQEESSKIKVKVKKKVHIIYCLYYISRKTANSFSVIYPLPLVLINLNSLSVSSSL